MRDDFGIGRQVLCVEWAQSSERFGGMRPCRFITIGAAVGILNSLRLEYILQMGIHEGEREKKKTQTNTHSRALLRSNIILAKKANNFPVQCAIYYKGTLASCLPKECPRNATIWAF